MGVQSPAVLWEVKVRCRGVLLCPFYCGCLCCDGYVGVTIKSWWHLWHELICELDIHSIWARQLKFHRIFKRRIFKYLPSTVRSRYIENKQKKKKSCLKMHNIDKVIHLGMMHAFIIVTLYIQVKITGAARLMNNNRRFFFVSLNSMWHSSLYYFNCSF